MTMNKINEINDDTDFFTNILVQICDYAVKNNLQPDNTIEIVAENMLSLLKISTFNGWGIKMAEYIVSEPLKKEIADFKRTVKCDNSDYLTGYICALSAVEGMIAEQPVADVQPVSHAEWEEVVTHNGCTPDYDCVCSNCKESGLPTYKYCPSCGSKMR